MCKHQHTCRLKYPGKSWRLPAAGSQCDRSIGPGLELADTSENNHHSDGHSFPQESAALLKGRGIRRRKKQISGGRRGGGRNGGRGGGVEEQHQEEKEEDKKVEVEEEKDEEDEKGSKKKVIINFNVGL